MSLVGPSADRSPLKSLWASSSWLSVLDRLRQLAGTLRMAEERLEEGTGQTCSEQGIVCTTA